MSRKPLKRKIHLPTGTWSYRIGTSMVIIRNSDMSKTFRVPLTNITGMTWEDIEKEQRKGGFSVRPYEIRRYIENKIGS